MSERELPPLRVSLLGDSKGYDKVMKSAIAQAQQLNSIFSRFNLNAPLTQARQLTAALKGMNNANLNQFKSQADALITRFQNLDRILNTIQKKTFGKGLGGGGSGAWAAAAASISRSIADAVKASAPQIGQSVRQALKSAAQVMDTVAKQFARTMQTGAKTVGQAIVQAGRVAAAAMSAAASVLSSAIRTAGAVASTAIRAAGQAISRAIVTAGRVAASAITAASRMYGSTTAMISSVSRSLIGGLASVGRTVGSVLSTSIRSAGQVANAAIRGGSQMGAAAIRSAGQVAAASIRSRSSGGGGGGGGGLGGGLSSRADIYMHANAMRALTQQSKGLLDMAVSFEQNQVAIQAFTGSARQAADVMKEIQDYALTSPYQTLQLADAARNMMAYGQSSKDTIANMKMLGDVAGGSQQRLDLLMYAMSQVTSLGKLQGNELRQLTEQGFNPLRTIAEHTRRANESMEQAMQRVNKAKEDGLITSKDVIEALKAETSGAGRFTDMANKMNSSLGGMISQLRELFQKVGLGIMKSLEDDMKKSLAKAIQLAKAISAWFDDPNNYETVQQIARMIKLVFVAILAFHGLGLAIAMIKWWISSAVSTLRGLSIVLLPIKLVLRSIVPIVTMLFQAFMFLLSPVGLIVAAIGLAAAGIIYFSGAGSEMLGFLSGKFQELGNIAVPVIQGITKALMQGQFQEAGQLAMLGLELAFRVGFREIYGIGRSFITGFLNAWTDMYTGLAINTTLGFTNVVNAFAGAGVALQNAFSIVVVSIQSLWDGIVTYIQGKWLYIKSFFDSSMNYNAEMDKLKTEAESRKITRQEDLDKTVNERGKALETANKGRTDYAQGMASIMQNEADRVKTERESADNTAKNAFDSRIGTIKTEMADVMQTIKRGTEEMGPPKPEPPRGPDYKPKFGLGASGGMAGYKASDAMSAYSGDYTKKAAEQAERVRQMRAGGPSQTPTVTQLITANTLLQLIAKNTAIGQTVVQAAGFTTP